LSVGFTFNHGDSLLLLHEQDVLSS
jgi:hypothetical protein